MLLSINWLKEFTPYNGSLDDLAHALTMLGLEVEEIYNPFDEIKDIIVGFVRETAPHPNADKLTVCTVDTGQGDPVQIICGAPNIAANQLVPVALPGTTMPNGQKIKKTRIRGIPSAGMICSAQELGLGEDHSGIMILREEAKPGQKLSTSLGLEEVVFDVGITPNRADCLSVLGLAREVAAYFDLPLIKPDIHIQEETSLARELLKIEIADPTLCPLYQARILQDMNIAPSPDWIRYRLLAIGQRPINNVVDITNYVLFEYGQPLHAFDRFLVTGEKIRVAPAGRPMTFTTLDGQTRELSGSDLLIWDTERPIALAGIMGGANSEIHPATTEAILECAIFRPATIRKTGRRLGISSEAGYRFERGVDQVSAQEALDRATSLLQIHAQAKILQGVIREEPRPWHSPRIVFRPERARKLLALDFDPAFAGNCLKRLGCTIDDASGQSWTVTPPSFRQDLEREVDLIEEVGRIYGLEKLPAQLPGLAKKLTGTPAGQPGSQEASFTFLQQIKTWAMGLGFKEVINYSFVGRNILRELGLDNDALISVHNPLSADQDTMRPVLLPGMLQNLKTNIRQHCPNVRIFEVARSFLNDHAAETQARETNKLGLLIHGSSTPGQWPWPKGQADYLDLKGCLEHLWSYLHLSPFSLDPEQDHPFLDPALKVIVQGTEAGYMGKVKPALAQDFDARFAVWYLEIDLDQLFSWSRNIQLEFRHWSRFPAIKRDLTIIAGLDLKYEQIVKAIHQARIPLLEDIALQDIYQPEETANHKHLTLRLTYRHPDRTLTDKEVDKRHQALGKHLLQSLPIRFP